MKKNRIRPIKAGNGIRMSYARQEEVLEMPNLIEVQKNSYKWLLTDGLREVFDDISTIVDYSGRYGLRFGKFTLEPKENHSIEVCKERDGTYSDALKVEVELVDMKEKKPINGKDKVFLGELPRMTDTGSFVINGAERVIVSQLVRSPGIYYSITHDKTGKELYASQVIPNRGAWLEYETDSNNIFYVKVDRNRKVPITVLIRALGVSLNKDIEDLFGDEPKLQASLAKDVSTNSDEGLLELYKKLRPGEPLLVENASNYITNMLFDAKRYDLAKVGRYKFNKKLAFRNRIVKHTLAEDVMDRSTGEIV